MTTLLNHIRYWSEIYVMPALFGLVLWLVISGVSSLTQREVIDDPGAIVGALYYLLPMVAVVMLTGITQHALYGYRSKGEGLHTIQDDIYDACVTSFLLLLFSLPILLPLIR